MDLADTLASDYAIGEFLHVLVERCKTILSVTTCGVLVEAEHGDLHLAAATSREMHDLEQAEIEHREGPSYEAYANVRAVVSDDLREERERWPRVIDQALDMGLLAAYAFPLRLREDCIGALNLYRDVVGGVGDDDIQLAQAFADVAAIGILQERKITTAERRAQQLQHALDSRVLIEQAKGVIAERHKVSVREAFEMLRSYARSNNRNIHDVCRDVRDGKQIGDL